MTMLNLVREALGPAKKISSAATGRERNGNGVDERKATDVY
jgi:hypothetical protein